MNSPEMVVVPEARTDEGWRGLIDFLSDWYWEQDENLRFTMMTGKRMREKNIDSSPIIGKLRWEQDRILDVDGPAWQEHKATLLAHQPFSNFTYRITALNGELRYIRISGQPFHDPDGSFKGYRGIGRDVTREVRTQARRSIEHAVTQILATTNSIGESGSRIIQTICENFNWNCAAYWECRAGEHSASEAALICAGSWGDGGIPADEFLRSRTYGTKACAGDKNLVCDAWEKGEPTWSADLAKDKGEALPPGALRSAFALPILANRRVIAVLEFHSDHVLKPDRELSECYAFVAGQIAQFDQLIRAREQLRQSEERFRGLIELSSDWIWEQDEGFRFTFFEGNQIVEATSGVKPTSRLGKRRWDLPALNLTEDDWAKHKAMLERHETFQDFLIRRSDLEGRERWMSVSGKPIYDAEGKFKGYRGIAKDVSERKNSERRIQYLATHDALTGLPNRTMFSELLNRAILAGRRYERKFAVLFVDLDRFKVVNDSLGHEAGDMLLKTAAKRLMHCLRDSDVIARVGGDEFVVLVQEVESLRDVETVAKKILATLFKPVTLLDQECRVTGSVGICLFPEHAQDEQSLMKNADAAMYQAKEAGKNQFAFFSAETKSQSLERIVMEGSLRRAIERKQLFLHYQCKLDLRTKRIAGVEALLRWQHPELGVVSPAQFIPLAEETGLIVPIGRWVLETACAQNVAWQKAGMPKMGMAVNISMRQFAEDMLVDDVQDALRKTGMEPELLELELTESMVVHKPERAVLMLKALKKIGVRIAIDDFGTGYSSLAQLKNFPIDTLKVDRSFIKDVSHNPEDQSMTRAIIAMGKSLGLTVVAEGVETEAQEAFLLDNACDETQGFYFSKPAVADAIESLLRSHAADSGHS
jgi:diguanylate cyclase (GGDEF)-like protein/PAS domain S-box-containing protein